MLRVPCTDGGAANDGVVPGRWRGQAVAVKYFRGLGPDGDPAEELAVGAALTQGAGVAGLAPRPVPPSLLRQIGVMRAPRLAAVFELVDGVPLAKKPLDTVRILRGRFERRSR
jgi:hypothetical protein